MSSMHDLAAAYVLGAVEGRELRQYEKHLASCESCPAEVARLSETASALATAAQTSPPERMRDAVLARASETTQEPRPMTDPVPQKRIWSWVAVAAAVTVALGVGSLVGIQVSNSNDTASEILAQSDARVVSLQGDGQANFVYSASSGQGVLIATELNEVDPDQTYQLWLIGESGAVPAGLFQPTNGAATVEVDGDIASASQLGITIEPVRGSMAPTGEIQLLADLG